MSGALEEWRGLMCCAEEVVVLGNAMVCLKG